MASVPASSGRRGSGGSSGRPGSKTKESIAPAVPRVASFTDDENHENGTADGFSFSFDDAKRLWQSYSRGDKMNPELWTKFQQEVQKESIAWPFSDDSIDFETFKDYLCSDANDIFLDTPQDMSHPLVDYFISSSHNTYLTDDQLIGDATADQYAIVLERGCRCVEMDVYDGDPQNGPIVHHGGTLVTKILLRNVFEAVRDSAFVVSPYPIILNIENHCTLPQQKMIASLALEIFGNALAVPPTGKMSSLPSPEELRGKVLLRDKAKGSAPELAKLIYLQKTPYKDTKAHLNVPCNATCSLSEAQVETELSKPTRTSKLLGMFKNKQTGGSLEKAREALIKHNRRVMARTYPAGMRVNSGNYDPLLCWQAGCQVVALNWQAYDRGMQLYEGFFRQNGGSGYVLKPEHMRSMSGRVSGGRDLLRKMSIKDGGLQTPLAMIREQLGGVSRISGQVKVSVQFYVINAQQLDKLLDIGEEIADPYVTVEVREGNFKRACPKQRTKTIQNNESCPEWREVFKFDVAAPTLALLRIVMKDEDQTTDDFIAAYSVPISSMRTGYRNIILHDAKYRNVYRLYCYISIGQDDSIPQELFNTE